MSDRWGKTHRLFRLPDGRWKAQCLICNQRLTQFIGETRHDAIRWWKNHQAEASEHHADTIRWTELLDRIFKDHEELTEDETAELTALRAKFKSDE